MPGRGPVAGDVVAVAPRAWRPVSRAVLTDSDRFPFDAEDLRRVSEARIALVEVPGHDPHDVAAAATGADVVFVYSARLDEKLIAQLRSCQLIVRCGSGFDLIDVVAARTRGIEVSYVPDYGTVDVAEHALALMLAVSRRLVDLDRVVRYGGWPSYAQAGTMHRLAGRRLGLVGFGRIAQRLAGVARALGMIVQGYDPHTGSEVFARCGVEGVTSAELLARSDVISLHVPLTAATTGLVDDAFLGRVRPGSILVNTSRGELVDEAALARALRDGRLAGAGLDVLATEPPSAHHPLLGLPGVVISPHSAAFTEEALASVRSQAVDELLRLAAGQPPRYPVPDDALRRTHDDC